MNFIDRIILSATLCNIWYYVENCPKWELILSLIILTPIWVLLGEISDEYLWYNKKRS